jgi:aminoglycoside phosphotransferase family enzyme
VIIDCLDFDLALRLLDPLSDLALLDLECQRLGNDWLGSDLTLRYARGTGDEGTPELLAFYRRYHALVRAALAAIRLDEPGADLKKWRARAQAYLQLAQAYRPPPGRGVSPVASALAPESPAARRNASSASR